MFLHVKALVVGLLCVFLAVGLAVKPVAGQVLYGSVIGTVTDPSGAVIPNVQLTLTGKDTGVSKETSTDGSGRYSFVDLLPGRYDLKASVTCFRSVSETNIEVIPNALARFYLKLVVGQISDTVNVEGSA